MSVTLFLIVNPDGSATICNPYQAAPPGTTKISKEVPDSLNWNGDESVLYYKNNEFHIQPPAPEPEEGYLYFWSYDTESYIKFKYP